MSIDFPLILFAVIIFFGFVALCDMIFCVYKGEKLFEKKKRPIVIEYARAFFPVLLLVFLIRSFVIQPYRVPTGSLEPTVIPGDFLLVNQYDYGLRFPIWNKKFLAVDEPTRGQIALFYYPVDHHFTFVKRVIGVPGDHISYINRTLYINGQAQSKTFLKNVTQLNDFGRLTTYAEYQENLMGIKHNIFIREDVPTTDFYNIVVPNNEYFMMGDNRSESDDSRYWGFVPEHDFIGRAILIWLSWDSDPTHWYDSVRWNRFGTRL